MIRKAYFSAKFDMNEKGLTLLEILVALGIFLIGVAGIYLLVVRGFVTQNFALDQTTAIGEAERGVEVMVRELRETQPSDIGAYPLELLDTDELVFYGDIDRDSQTERVHYRLVGTNFIKGVIEPTGDPITYPLGNESTSTISQYVQNGAIVPIFTYYNGNWPGGDGALDTPADPTNVKLVKTLLKINVFPNRAPLDFDLESNVQLRNLKGNL